MNPGLGIGAHTPVPLFDCRTPSSQLDPGSLCVWCPPASHPLTSLSGSHPLTCPHMHLQSHFMNTLYLDFISLPVFPLALSSAM